MLNKYLSFFSCCRPVKGYRRSLILDLQRNKIYFVPNDLIDIFSSERKLTKIFEGFDNENQKTLEEYIDFLIEKEIVHISDSKKENSYFTSLNMSWDFPAKISNLLIEISSITEKYISNLAIQINKLNSYAISLLFYENTDLEKLQSIIKYFNKTSVMNIHIYINDNPSFEKDKLIELANKNLRITSFNIFNTNKDFSYLKTFVSVKSYSSQLTGLETCGKVSAEYFVNNIAFFTESQNYNTCLNRKICIDSNGYIKNCHSMQQNYGHISDTSLLEAIEKPGFKDLWYVKKDDIDVCKDCEFRHICTDCRAHIKDPNNIYSQPSKCGYNPYIALWEGQEGWISVGQWRKENLDLIIK